MIKIYIYRLLDICFHFIHLGIIFFFLFGWMFDTTIVVHLLLSFAILFSWVVLGIFYGFGYCLITDIQWKIKKLLSEEPSTKYYVKYMLDKMSGKNMNEKVVDKMTTYIYFSIFLISLSLLLNT